MIISKRAASRKPCKKQAQDLGKQGENKSSVSGSSNYSNSCVTSIFSYILSLSSKTSNSNFSANKNKLLCKHESKIHIKKIQKNVFLSRKIRDMLKHDDKKSTQQIKSSCESESTDSSATSSKEYRVNFK